MLRLFSRFLSVCLSIGYRLTQKYKRIFMKFSKGYETINKIMGVIRIRIELFHFTTFGAVK